MNDFIEKIKLEVLEEAIKYLEELMPSEMICILNRDFCYEYINENPYMNILGYSKEDLLGKSPRKILHPSDLEKLDINLRIGADIGDDIPAFRIKHNNGSWKWVEIRGKVFQDENGETKILVISSDITDRIDTEKLLKESEEKYRLISENANDIIVILSQNFAIEYCNQSYYRVLGYQKGEVIGKTPKDFIHPDDYENAINALKKGFIRGEGMKEVRVKHRKGHYLWFEIKGNIYTDTQGNQKALLILRDTSEKKKAEIILRKSEQKFRRLHEKSPNARVIANTKGIILECNAATEKLFGFKKKELIGRNYVNLGMFTSEQIADLEAMYKDFLKGKELEPTEIQIRRKDGSLAWVNHQSTLIKLENEFLIEIIFQDITDRKKVEQELKDSEEKYRLMVENTTDMIVKTDVDGRLVFVSPSYCKTFGKTEEDLLDKNFLPLVHEDDREITAKEREKLLQPPYRTHFEQRALTIDGWRWIEWSDVALLNPDNNVIGVIGVGRDITSRKIVEEELTRIKKAMESTSDAIGISNPEGHHIFQNQAFTTLFEYNAEELEATGGGPAVYVEPNIGQEVFDTIMSGNSWVGEIEMKTKSGRIFPVLLRADAIKDNEGNIIGLIGVHTDITERKKVENELKMSEEQFRRAYNQAEFYKDVFTHDINNILNAIQLSSDLTSFYLNEPDKLRELTDIIVKHVDRGAELVKNIQKLSRLDEIAMVLEPVDVKKVLNDSINFLKDSIQDKELDIKIDAPHEELLVKANEFLLDIFVNILVNAEIYNDNQKIVISIKLSNLKENGISYIKIEFIDNARGIQDIEKRAILKKGFKKDRRSQGLGIGLSLVKKIIEGYDGRIWVENRILEDHSKGSNFILLVPKAD